MVKQLQFYRVLYYIYSIGCLRHQENKKLIVYSYRKVLFKRLNKFIYLEIPRPGYKRGEEEEEELTDF